MKLLFIGAGPIGCLYAGRLALSGHEVVLIARGERLAALRERGLSLVNAETGREERPELSIVDAADMAVSAFGLRAERFDAAILAVRSERLALALPDLAACSGARRLVTFVNQADGGDAAAGFLGAERLVLGFPGATASFGADGRLVFSIVPASLQRTSFGLPRGARDGDGESMHCARELASATSRAGFRSAVSRDMRSWLATHAAFIGPVGAALLAAGGLGALSRDRGLSAELLDAAREGFASLRAAGLGIEPPKLRLLATAPRAILLKAMPLVLRSRFMRSSVGGHAAVSAEEMRFLLAASVERRREAGLGSPSCEALLRRIAALP